MTRKWAEDTDKKALEDASRTTRERMKSDLDRLPCAAQAPVAQWMDRVFEENAGDAEEQREWLVQFRALLGQSSRRYQLEARMETGVQLLHQADLPVGTVGRLVGYSDSRSFYRAFGRYCGLSPSALRECLRKAAERVPRGTSLLSMDTCRRLAQGELKAQSAQNLLLDWLRTLYSTTEGRSEREWADKAGRTECDEEFTLRLAEALIVRLPENRNHHLASSLRLFSPRLFDAVCEVSLAKSRYNPYEGILAASLALELLDTVEEKGWCEEVTELRVLGWARKANAHRLGNDHMMAESCFEHAKDLLAEMEDELNPKVGAEMCALEGSLRLDQRNYREAERLLTRSVGLCRSPLVESILLVKSLIQRASILIYSGRPESSWSDLEQALDELGDQRDSPLWAQIHQGLAISKLLSGRLQDAECHLIQARELCDSSRQPLVALQLDQISGMVSAEKGDLEEAGLAFKRARTGMIELGRMDNAAGVSVEYALIERRRGNIPEAIRLASEAFRLFDALAIDPEAKAALIELRRSLGVGMLNEEVLLEVRRHLRRLNLFSR